MDLLSKKYAQAKEIAELKAENDRLKKELKNNKSAYEVELGTYNMECGNLLEENKQYYQTLQEIKEIVKNICDGCTSECDCDEDCNYFLINEALTKAEEE